MSSIEANKISTIPMDEYYINNALRHKREGAGPVIWLTGLSGSGKTTLGTLLLKRFRSEGIPADLIDGDEVRSFFEDTADYSRENRINNIKRIVFAAACLSRNGIVAIVSNIAPYWEARTFARAKLQRYYQVYLKSSLEELRRRDVKGIYAKAAQGKIRNVIGLDEPYEEPRNPDLVIETNRSSAKESLQKVLSFLKNKKVL